ncbi:MAG TPA: CAP domain-containing protein [Patescibacteria group bacterium]|nr:CAP domain-containing protein [Patescibacteria group bacterium]
MRVPALVGGVVLVGLLTAGVTTVALAHPTAANGNPVAQAPVTADSAISNDPAPQRMIPRPALGPSPVPSPVAPPPTGSRPISAPVYATLVVGSAQQAYINQDRVANGLRPLTWSSCLARVAASNASRMAAQGFISHTNGPYADLACGLNSTAGENVGDWSGGVNDSLLNTMFMNSAGHRANILGPYRYVATAWVVGSNGYGYVAVEFS